MENPTHSVRLRLVVIVTFALLSALAGGWTAYGGGDDKAGVGAGVVPPLPAEPFSPSNARTEDGALIPSAQFIPAARCASCHKDSHEQWSESLHRNAGREPFYKDSVDILQRTRGVEFARHCEACHAPVALFSGALTTGSKEPRTMDDEGVTCTVCHSITEVRLDGTGSYTIRRPALLEREDGRPVFGDVSDAEIMADVPSHRRAMMRPLLKTPEFCASCHKSIAPPELNGYKFIRGFSVYDEWQQSGASAETVTPFYRKPNQVDCRSCHMPPADASEDKSAKEGVIASHRWPGANTITPLFYGQKRQVEVTTDFLRDKVLNVDIFALRREATGERALALDAKAENRLAFAPGEEVTAEVVIANKKAGHSFPPELRDMYEPWVEFEAIDAEGKTVFHSGFIRPDQSLDESAHVYKAILLDYAGRPLTRHQVWLGTIKAYDNFVNAGRSDIARYRFRVPSEAATGAGVALTLRARVNYRRFIQEYTEHVLGSRGVKLVPPVVRMAESEVKLVFGTSATTAAKPASVNAASAKAAPAAAGAPTPGELQARRWNDYGIGLLEQMQYGPAADAFRRASALNAKDSDLLVNASIAEMRTEQFGLARDQIGKAAVLLRRALKLNPTDARARFFNALLMRADRNPVAAAGELTKLAQEHPRDREVRRQLGQTLYLLGRMPEARAAFEAILAIDPNDAGAYQFLSPIYASEGRAEDAARAQKLYLLWRDDPLTDPLAARFFAANPQWADERVWSHSHASDSPPRPTLTGSLAAPAH
jgi:Flp pilus assembly protein TadD/nitrate/TMAO reductase-like tetraheme cytochrome c subunit